jgi:signal transduction histidine kinase
VPSSAHSLPRSTALVRLLLQLRIALTVGAVVLLVPGGELTWPVAAAAAVYVALTVVAALRWRDLAPRIQRHPVLITSDIACAFVILLVAGPAGPFFVATVLTSAVAGILFPLRGVLLVAAFQVLCYLGALLGPDVVLGPQELVIHPLLYLVAGLAGIRLRGIYAELAAEQTARHDAERAVAAAEERARLARDMHDSVAKTLRGTALSAQALPMWMERDPERALATAREISHAADTAALEARQLLDGLREDAPAEFTAAVAEAAAQFQERSGLAVQTQLEDPGVELGAIARHEALAILGEALANAERHASAQHLTVELAREDDHAVLSIRDDGVGFSPDDTPEGHYGLRGMHERAAHAGSELSVTSVRGEGTTVCLRLPLMLTTTPP